MAPGVIRSSDVADSVWTPEASLAVGDWTLWVRSRFTTESSVEFGQWRTAASITIGGRPSLLSPTNEKSGSFQNFRWTPVRGASRYILHIENADGDIVIRRDDLTDETFVATAELIRGDYRVWIKAISAEESVTGSWSRGVRFAIR